MGRLSHLAPKPDTTPIASQAAKLLKLPPELRNIIYHAAVIDEGEIMVCDGGTGHTKGREPALSRTCRQLRQEFLPICKAATPTWAHTFTIKLIDFTTSDFSQRLTWVAPREDGKCRRCKFEIFVTNALESHTQYLRTFFYHETGPRYYRPHFAWDELDYEFHISFEGRSFDIGACRQLLARLAHNLGRGPDRKWEMLKRAFEEAFERHEALERERKVKRKTAARSGRSKKQKQVA